MSDFRHPHVERAGTHKMTSGMTGSRESNVNRILSANQLIFLFYHRYTLSRFQELWLLAVSRSHPYWFITKEKGEHLFQPVLLWEIPGKGRPAFTRVRSLGQRVGAQPADCGVCQKWGGGVAGETNPVIPITVIISILSEPSSHFYESLKWRNLGQHEGAVLPICLALHFIVF